MDSYVIACNLLKKFLAICIMFCEITMVSVFCLPTHLLCVWPGCPSQEPKQSYSNINSKMWDLEISNWRNENKKKRDLLSVLFWNESLVMIEWRYDDSDGDEFDQQEHDIYTHHHHNRNIDGDDDDDDDVMTMMSWHVWPSTRAIALISVSVSAALNSVKGKTMNNVKVMRITLAVVMITDQCISQSQSIQLVGDHWSVCHCQQYHYHASLLWTSRGNHWETCLDRNSYVTETMSVSVERFLLSIHWPWSSWNHWETCFDQS